MLQHGKCCSLFFFDVWVTPHGPLEFSMVQASQQVFDSLFGTFSRIRLNGQVM